jgi:phage tail sheath protein FI
MTEYLAPGIYIEEVPFGSHPIEGVSTTTGGFIGAAEGPHVSGAITSFLEFAQVAAPTSSEYVSSAVKGFFDNGGRRAYVAWVPAAGPVEAGMEALASEPVSILCCPDAHVFPNSGTAMAAHCAERKDRFCILHSPQAVVPHAAHEPPVRSSFAAYCHPWLIVSRPDGNSTQAVPPSGHVAGAYARTDTEKGVWVSPAGAAIRGAAALSQEVTEADAALLVDRGIDVLRNVPGRGMVVWGARTTSEDPEWKYVSVRRLLIFLEQSLSRGLQWTVFEPNGSALCETVRAAIEGFLLGLWRSGALMGNRPEQACFVRCDRTTMTQDDIDSGRLVAVVGVAPVRPAEFVILRITSKNATGPG